MPIDADDDSNDFSIAHFRSRNYNDFRNSATTPDENNRSRVETKKKF